MSRFKMPLDAWFRSSLREMAGDLLLAPSSFAMRTVEPRAVRTLLDDHFSARRDEAIGIWTLLSLEVRHDVFFRATATAPIAASSAPGSWPES